MALQNMAAMRVEHVARMMAPAVEYLFSIVHEIISKHRNKPLAIQLRGQWTTVDPQAWRHKRDCKISVGVGAGNKDSMLMQLQQVLAAQMQVGLPLGLVGREQIQATNLEIVKLAGFSNPQKFWPDPRMLPPQQPQMPPEAIKAQADMQMAQFKAQQDQQKFAAEQSLEQQRMQMQAELDTNREEMQARQKALEAEMKAAFEREKMASQERIEAERLALEKYKVDLQAAVSVQSTETSARTTMEAAQLGKQPDNRVDELLKTIEALQSEMSAPSELVRDESGRAVAVKRGDRVRKIVRGPDGRAVGVQ